MTNNVSKLTPGKWKECFCLLAMLYLTIALYALLMHCIKNSRRAVTDALLLLYYNLT